MAEFVEFMDHSTSSFFLTLQHNTIKLGLVLNYIGHLHITEQSGTKLTKQCNTQLTVLSVKVISFIH